MRATFDRAKVIVDGDDAYLCLAVPYRDAKKFVGEMKPKKYQVEIKLYRKPRSRNANDYLWALLDQLADVLSTPGAMLTKEELYRGYVKEYGIFKDFECREGQASTFCHVWGELGIGWFTEQVDYAPDGEHLIIRAYYGTSKYNSKQMSRILSAVVDDCREQGIETLTPRELALLANN